MDHVTSSLRYEKALFFSMNTTIIIKYITCWNISLIIFRSAVTQLVIDVVEYDVRTFIKPKISESTSLLFNPFYITTLEILADASEKNLLSSMLFSFLSLPCESNRKGGTSIKLI